MDYIELTIPVADAEQAEILTALLSDFPFESFAEQDGALKVYAPAEKLAECKDAVDDLLAWQGVTGTFIRIEAVNWNARWESDFEPVVVDDRLAIRAPFHEPSPAGVLEVVIMPKMSFGTGHHATTHLMSAEVVSPEYDWHGKRGLDMGSGTCVLAIVAAKLGADHVDAIDIDAWAFENGTENIAANCVSDRVTPLLGDASLIGGRTYDFVLANINRNILLSDMAAYEASLIRGGYLLMSGFLEADIPAISEKAVSLGFGITKTRLRNNWALVVCRKN